MNRDDIDAAYNATRNYYSILKALNDAKTWKEPIPMRSDGTSIDIDPDLVVRMMEHAAARALTKMQSLGVE